MIAHTSPRRSALFAFLHLLNFFLIGLGSAGAVPFGTFAAIALLWFGIHVPLTIIGGWIGVKRGVSGRDRPGLGGPVTELTLETLPSRSASRRASMRSRGRCRRPSGGCDRCRPRSSPASCRSAPASSRYTTS